MAVVTAPRFMGIPQFEKALNGARMFDDGGDLVVDEPNDPGAVTAIQTTLAEFHAVIAVTGVYDEHAAEAVQLFKIEQNLALPPGLAQHDGVTGPGTTGHLNQLFTPPPPKPDPQLHYTDRKSFYTNIALGKAHDNAHPEWLPEAGYAANRPRSVDVYAYYRDLHLAQPEQILWAGLGHLAGGAVIGGLDSDPGLISQPIMVRIGRDIFFDLAWLHEAFLDRADTVVELAGRHDQFNTYPTYDALGVPGHAPGVPARSYKAAWEEIVSGNPQKVSESNHDLLESEQRSIILALHQRDPPLPPGPSSWRFPPGTCWSSPTAGVG